MTMERTVLDDLTPEQRAAVDRFDAGEDIGDGGEPVELEVRRPLGKVVPIRMSDDQWRVLTREAEELGTRPSTLLRMWLLERLREVARRSGTREDPGATRPPRRRLTGETTASRSESTDMRLAVNEERVQTGEVEVGKRVVEEQKTMEVPVTHEEIVIERRPVNRPSDTPITEDARTIEVPVTEERVNVEKQTVVREEIGFGRRVEQDTGLVSGAVGRGEPTGHWSGADWNAFVSIFRRDWQANHEPTGRWEDREPMYRYAFDQFTSGRWGGRPWGEVEAGLRSAWSDRYPNLPWHHAAGPVEFAWGYLTSTHRTPAP
jgi:uncharacterized protein (TIGR02271 family)